MNCWILFYVSSNIITGLLHKNVIEAPTTTEMTGNDFFGQMTRFMFLKYHESIVASWKYCYQRAFALSVEIVGLTLSVGFLLPY